MKHSDKGRQLTYAAILGSILFISLIYLYKIKFYPPCGGDEASLSSIFYRIRAFGDAQYAVFYPSSVYDLGLLRGTPFASAFACREFFHLLFGFSPELGRIFSSILMLSSTLIVIGVCKKTFPKLTPASLILLAIAIGLTPSMIFNARGMRTEQEILFLGILGTLGLLFFLYKSKHKLLLWIISGISMGIAGSTHPFGIVFPGVMLYCLLVHHKGWHRLDHLTLRQRLCAWGSGICIPGIIAMCDLLPRIDNHLVFIKGVSTFQALRTQTFIDIFSQAYSGLLHQFLPDRMKASLYQLTYYSFSIEFMPFFAQWYRFIVFMSLGLAILCLIPVIRNRKKSTILPLALSCYLVIGVLCCTLLFTPNQTYHVYLSFSLSTFLCILYCTFSYNSLQHFPRPRIFSFVGKLSLYALFCLNILSACTLLRTLSSLNTHTIVSFDALSTTVESLKTDLGVPTLPNGETLTDSYTWSFAGKHAGAWATTIAELPSNKIPIAGAFRGDVIDFLINVFPTMTPIQPSIATKRRNFYKVLDTLTLKAILLAAPSKEDYYFYIKPELTKKDFRFVVMQNDVEQLSFVCEHPSSPLLEKQEDTHSLWSIPQEGLYILILPSIAKGSPTLIHVLQNGMEVKPQWQSQETTDAPRFYVFPLKQGSLHIQGLHPEQITLFDHLHPKS